MLLVVSCAGCAARWLPEYDVATFERYRVDVLDGNNIWGPVGASDALGESEQFVSAASNEGTPEGTGLNGGASPQAIAYTSADSLTTKGSLGFVDLVPSGSNFSSRSHTQARVAHAERVVRFSFPLDRIVEAEATSDGKLSSFFDVSYGARYVQRDDIYGWQYHDRWSGDTFSTTNSDSKVFGPQLGLTASVKKGGWQFSVGGSMLFGMLMQDTVQQNSNTIWRYTTSRSPGTILYEYGDRETSFSPIGEFLVQTSYQLSNRLAFHLGYAAMQFGEMRFAEESIAYVLPAGGLKNAGATRDINIDGLFARTEYRW